MIKFYMSILSYWKIEFVIDGELIPQEWMDFHENCQTVRRFIGIFLLAIHSVGIYKFVQ